MTLTRKTPLKRTCFTKKTERPTFAWPMAMADILKANKDVTTAANMVSKPKPRKKMKPRAASNKGWVDVAEAIWNKSDNSRCCEVCGCFLGDNFSPAFYHHLLHRGSYRRFKREPRNLAQVCVKHHSEAHEFGIENLAGEGVEFPDGWHRLNMRMLELRDQANGITP
jgi:hypothetical protein